MLDKPHNLRNLCRTFTQSKDATPGRPIVLAARATFFLGARDKRRAADEFMRRQTGGVASSCLRLSCRHRVGLWKPKGSPNLGRREVQCLKLAAEGLKAKQIAITFGIGEQTVQFHLSRAREKLNCSNTVQAVARAAQFGLLPDIAPSSAKDSAGNSETPA